MTGDVAAVRVMVYGYVQGVFFRVFVARRVGELGVNGYVRNVSGGKAVEVYAEGERAKLERLIACLNTGPPAARVERVVADWSEYTGGYPGFAIRY